ncbi:hypothetical protein M2271_008498, partial [Streptomyces sp. LBL]|nr:hypothetical protein [Streptomyces sp. LBL]
MTGTMLLLKRRKERAALLATVGGGGSDVAPPDSDALGDAKDLKRLAKDQQWFLPIFIVKVALGLVAFAFKPTLGLLFFAAYAVYFWREIRSSKAAEDDEELEPLKFQPGKAAPATWAVVAQTLATLAVIFFAAHFFVPQRHRPAAHHLAFQRRSAVVRHHHHGRDHLPAADHAQPSAHPGPPGRGRRVLRRLCSRPDSHPGLTPRGASVPRHRPLRGVQAEVAGHRAGVRGHRGARAGRWQVTLV